MIDLVGLYVYRYPYICSNWVIGDDVLGNGYDTCCLR